MGGWIRFQSEPPFPSGTNEAIGLRPPTEGKFQRIPYNVDHPGVEMSPRTDKLGSRLESTIIRCFF